ncbi:hypothetical protein ES703_39616 [subsurface metagenome]
MVYRHRYMRPFVGTTIVIQDDAITPDKVDDKAIEEKHLADGVVSERTIGPSAVDTDAIKDGEVKTADIGDGQVTESKLADGAVTEDKLSFTPSSRPLTPGVSSAEILDDAVIESKYGDDSIPSAAYKPGSVDEAALGGDAVTEVKIKDRNVTSDKVALDSLGNEHLKADSVRGTEIQAGAVGTSELSTDAVETVKIKDVNVTEPKLEADILRKLLDSTQLLYDDFIGATMRPEWASSGDPGGNVSHVNSMLKIMTNNVTGEQYRVNTGADFFTSQGDKPRFFVRSRQPLTNIHIRFGLYKDDNNYILFDFDTAVDGNWHAKTKKLGAETDGDTGVAATDVLHKFFFDVQSAARVEFYIDGVLKNLSLTNIPLESLQPFLEVQTRANATKLFTVDKVIFSSDDSIGVPPP